MTTITTTDGGYSVSVQQDGHAWRYHLRIGLETHTGTKATRDEADAHAYALLERLQQYKGITID